jgi:hypothetical protein
MTKAVAAKPTMPVFNSEVCYENIMGGSLQDVQRFLFWTMMTSGACGHTYGAQGIWAMSSRDEPFEGTTGSWGDGYWQDVMHLPGSAQVGIGRRFFERYPWWDFAPLDEPAVHEKERRYSFACGVPGRVLVYYLPARCMDDKLMGARDCPLTIGRDTPWTASFFDPRTGRDVPVGDVTCDATGKWTPPGAPTMADWVLVLANRESLKVSGR